MKKFEARVSYPWAGIEDDVEVVELDDNISEEEVEIEMQEVLEEMIYNRLSTSWEEVANG